MKLLLLLLFVALVPSTYGDSGFSYNISSAYINHWSGLTFGREYRKNIETIDLSGLLWTAQALNTSVKVLPGLKFSFKTMPRDSEAYRVFEKEANLYKNDFEEYLEFDDLEPTVSQKEAVSLSDEEPQEAESVQFANQDPSIAKDIESAPLKERRVLVEEQFTWIATRATGSSSPSKTVKTVLSCTTCLGMSLEHENGVLFSLKNASVTIDTTLKLPSQSFPLKIDLRGVELNHTLHFRNNKNVFELLSAMCRMTYKSMIIQKSPLDSLKADMREEMKENFMKSVCNKINANSKEMFSNVESPMVFKLQDGLYFDGRINKFDMDAEGFGFEHKAEFIYHPKKIEEIESMASDFVREEFKTRRSKMSYYDFVRNWSLNNMCKSINEKKIVKEYVIINKTEPTINTTNLTPRAFKYPFRRPIYPYGNYYSQFLYNDMVKSFDVMSNWFIGHNRMKRGAPFISARQSTTSEMKTGLSLKLKDKVFNSLFEGLVFNNVTRVHLNKDDVQKLCENKTDSFCVEMIKCSELDNDFSLTLELMRNVEGKYVVFDDEAVSTNFSVSVDINGKTIEMEMYTKTRFSLIENNLYYEVMQARVTLTAGSSLHSVFMPKWLSGALIEASRGQLTRNHWITLHLNKGTMHVTTKLPVETGY